MDDIVLVGYFLSLAILFVFGCHGFIMIYYHRKYKSVKPAFKKNSLLIQKLQFNCLFTMSFMLLKD